MKARHFSQGTWADLGCPSSQTLPQQALQRCCKDMAVVSVVGSGLPGKRIQTQGPLWELRGTACGSSGSLSQPLSSGLPTSPSPEKTQGLHAQDWRGLWEPAASGLHTLGCPVGKKLISIPMHIVICTRPAVSWMLAKPQ